MDLNEFFEKNRVTKKGFYHDVEYSGLDNIVGKRVWICDYRNNGNDIFNKPIRCIKPTYVEVCLPSKRKEEVYYSPIHFKEFGKKGKLLSRVIAPYDNTGFRCYTGVSLNIFDTEIECKAYFKGQIDEAIEEIQKAEEKHRHYVSDRIESLLKLKEL